MSHSNTITNLQPGEIECQELPGKVRFFAWNNEARKKKHIGSLIGAVYEKVQSILQKPEPSFALTSTELKAVITYEAQFIRIICNGSTYSISLADFRRYGVQHFNGIYGEQVRVPLKHFSFMAKATKRNPILDNPVTPSDEPLQVETIKPQPLWKSLDLFSR